MPQGTLQKNYIDEEQLLPTDPTAREKPQQNFRPATASTPVHRLIASVDQRVYMATNQTGTNDRFQQK